MNIENDSVLSTDNYDSEQDNKAAKALQELGEIKEELGILKDLFIRRLNDDKQKSQLIHTLDSGARFAFIEPFLADIILVLDRLEKSDDDFIQSVYEEIYDILYRRGVERITVSEKFNPALYKAVKRNENPNIHSVSVTGIIRNGYTFSGKVIRAAEVIVDVPVKS